jgi:adenine-specific DNA-methyltransferase
MSQNYEKLKTLLKELFQLDQPDLDFGLYRVMHAKSAEVSQFLDKDLLPQVKAAFSLYKTADKAEIEKELFKVIAGIEAAGMDPAQSPKVNELRARLKSDAVDVSALESEVYDRLFSFFRRYYSEGDFLAKRVYKPGVYAIPYEGEEVTLHWANKDQYYIKTSEYLRDYVFRLRLDDDKKPMRVHFRLTDAAEGEHGNIKAPEGKDRVFILVAPGDSGRGFILEEEGEAGKELVIRFEYRPATLTDWSEESRESKSKPPAQKDLIALAIKRLLAVTDTSLAGWITELSKPHVTTSGEKADYTRLEAHLKRYTARNTFDYFIHKDLGAFLRRELDFYIKNEVMHLDDVENESAPRVEQYLSKIKVIRCIAGKIIDFLAQLEDFQKKIWLKKKFVVDTRYCITLCCIPEELYPEIAANDAQREEWVRLFAIDEMIGDLAMPRYSAPLTVEFLKAHPTLVMETKYYDADFIARLLEAIGVADENIDGVLFQSENFQALSLMQSRYREQVKCIYIDPPYNANSSEIIYKNTYKHSSWLSLIENRLLASKNLLAKDFVNITAIDEVEQEVLGRLFSELFSECEKSCISIVHNATGQQGANFSFTHEYAYFIFPFPGKYIGLENRDDNPDVRPLRNVSKGSHLRSDAANCFYPVYVKDGRIIGFGDVCSDDFHPSGINVESQDGIIEVYPIDPQGIERKWVFARNTVESILDELEAKFDRNNNKWDIIRTKKTFNYKTVWTGSKYSANSYGSRLLNEILPSNPFTFPKSIFTVRDCLDAGLKNQNFGTVLDYFAGSGTTGHAVINLNREDGGSRKFILVEMGDYFDTVLLPRIKKVTYTPEWKDGKPKRMATPEEATHSPRILKVIRLESYEDALNNLETHRTDTQQLLLRASAAQGPDGFKEQYLLRYMLNVETRGSQSLLNVQAFTDPMTYKLKVKRPGSDESREVNVDLLETFNWLIGLFVKHIAAPQSFTADFERDSEKRLRLKGRLKQATDGPYWFRTVTGTTPDGRKTLIIWRKTTGEPEQDNLVLDEWFTKQGYSAKDSEFDLIYVNGGNNLENLKAPDDTWKVRLIEEDFHRLMFDTEGV